MLEKDICLRNEILTLLKNNNGSMEEKLVCEHLRIARSDIPWGYKIGWARCIQQGGKFHLILANYNEHDEFILGDKNS